MTAQTEPNTLSVVEQHRGRRIAERREALGLSVSELARHAHLDRGTLTNVEADRPKVRPATYGAVEAALSKLEEEMGMDDGPSPVADSEMVEFHISGNFGVDVVVKGPLREVDQLEASVSRLLAKMQQQRAEDRD